MSVRRATCPECGARFRFEQPASKTGKIRCVQCKEVFRLPDDKEDVPDEKPARTRRQGKKASSGNSSTMLYLGVGVSMLLVLAFAGGLVAVVMKGKKPVVASGEDKHPPNGGNPPVGPTPTPGPGDTKPSTPVIDVARVTPENFMKVKPGFTRQEVEAIFHPGAESSFQDIQNTHVSLFGPINGPTRLAALRFSAAKTFTVWTGNGLRIYVGYGKDKSGTDRACYSFYLRETGPKGPEAIQGISSSSGSADRYAKEWEEEKRLYADARFKHSKDETARLLLGTWWDEGATQCYQFNADGKFRQDKLREDRGTYRLVNAGELETHERNPFNKDGTTWRYRVLVSDSELYLYRDLNPFASMRKGPMYRITPEGGNLGQQKVVDPLAKKVQSSNPTDRQVGVNGLARLGAGATPAVGVIIVALKDGNSTIRKVACQGIGGIGPAAKAAVPALLELTNDPEVALWAIGALGGIGPPAREALPRLRELVRGGKVGISNQAEGAIKRIEH